MEHDFSELFAQYPAIIEQMPGTFKSHEFILKLAHQNQRLYIEALCSYRDSAAPIRECFIATCHNTLKLCQTSLSIRER